MSKPNQDGHEQKAANEELGDDALEQVSGGIALLLPAVQKVRSAGLTSETDEASVAITFAKKG